MNFYAKVNKSTSLVIEVISFPGAIDMDSMIPLDPGEKWDACPKGTRQGDAILNGSLYAKPDHAVEFNPETPGWTINLSSLLVQAKAQKIAAIDARTSEMILAGFDFQVPAGTLTEIDGKQVDVGGETYRFNYSAEDQANFTDGVLACTLAMQTGDAVFRQSWRGWQGDRPFVLSFTASAFIALTTYAKMNHKQGKLASGWAITDAIRAATTVEEVEAIVDDRE